MPQGVLGFQYEIEKTESGLTSLGGLPLAMDVAKAVGLADLADSEIGARRNSQGYTDAQFLMAGVLLQIAGGDCVDDLDRLEQDDGFSWLLRDVEIRGLPRAERRRLKHRWAKLKRSRAVPSPTAMREWLKTFHPEGLDEARKLWEEETGGKAFVPEPNDFLRGLWRINAGILAKLQKWSPETTATLDADATVLSCFKENAFSSYKGPPGYQPHNIWWAEQRYLTHTDFRDGNVPAGYEALRVFQEALGMLPEGIERVYYRADSASFQEELLQFLEQGKDPRFGRIGFAISVPICRELRAVLERVPEEAWQQLYVYSEAGERKESGYEWVEVDYVPGSVGRTKKGTFRFLATRELLSQGFLPGTPQQELPFPVTWKNNQSYKLHTVVTNLRPEEGWEGEDVLLWHRERCGKSEEVHAVLKHDLGGGKMPSKYFGSNAAWWWIAVLAHNLMGILKRVFLGGEWAERRFKALRFHLIHLPGRVLRHARGITLRLAAKARDLLDQLLTVRKAILAKASGA